MLRACLFLMAAAAAPNALAQTLSFADAVAAADAGPSVSAAAAAVEAARRDAGPAGALPDPQLVLALENVPATGADRFRLDRDDMTMRRFGLMQELPSFAELGARRAAARAEVQAADAAAAAQRLQARLAAARAWIGLHYAEQRLPLAMRAAREARALADAARGALAAGGGSADAAIEAEIEAAASEDRAAAAEAQAYAMRAELRRWIGPAASAPVSEEAPRFSFDESALLFHLQHHPGLAAAEAESARAEAGGRMARAERWPDWSVELSYGQRAPGLSDMASVEVRVGLPLFQPWRQGPAIAARRADFDRAEAERDAVLREHEAMIEAGLARHTALSANAERARNVRLPLARQRAEAAAGSFAAGAGGAQEAGRARLAAIDAELDALSIEEELALTGAELVLQYAEPAP